MQLNDKYNKNMEPVRTLFNGLYAVHLIEHYNEHLYRFYHSATLEHINHTP